METFIGCELWPGYRFGDQGTVLGKDGRILKPCINNRGYKMINVCIDGKGHIKTVHRLIAIAFNLPNPDNKSEIDHINQNKLDNRLINLRWATRKEQIANRNYNALNKFGIYGLTFRRGLWEAHNRREKTYKSFKDRPEAESFLEEISHTQ